jgi:hypothetical protein
MRRLIALLLGVAIGGGLMFGAFQYHVLRTDKTFLFIRKQSADWHDAYVDIRGWTYRDWANHRVLSNNLIAAGRGDLVTRSVADQLFRGFFDPFREPSPDGRNSNTHVPK